jgi:hypothetical protein
MDKEAIMSVPTRYNPKRLSDYAVRGGTGSPRKPGRGIQRAGPTAAERTKASRDKYKQFVMNDIASSDRRRKALETMWTAEQDKVTAERKSAVDEYNSVMKNAPDFGDDDEGLLRAAWENEPHVQAAKDRMKTHIEASLNQSNRGKSSMQVAPGSAELGKAQFGTKFQPLAPKYSGGFGQPPKAKPGDPEAGDIRTIGNVKVTFSGEIIGKGGKEFLMGTDENGNRVGVPRAELSKKSKKDPEVEPTGAEYRGSKALRAIGGAVVGTAQREDVPFTP